MQCVEVIEESRKLWYCQEYLLIIQACLGMFNFMFTHKHTGNDDSNKDPNKNPTKISHYVQSLLYDDDDDNDDDDSDDKVLMLFLFVKIY